MLFINKHNLFKLAVFIIIAGTFLFPSNSSADSFASDGLITSTNFLPVSGSSLINSVSYDASSIPTGTSIKMQFSYDGVNWYNSQGVLDDFTVLSVGENSIDLSSLGWKKQFFYYRALFISDTTATPVLNSVILAFLDVDGNYYTYSSNGTLTSANLVPDGGVASINGFGYTISSLPPNTGAQIQFSQDNSNWYNSLGTINAYDTLSAGSNVINLAGLGWSGNAFYYRVIFASTDGQNTPILDRINLNYLSNNMYWVGVSGGNWNDGANWSATSGGVGGVGVPGSTNRIFFNASSTGNVNVEYSRILEDWSTQILQNGITFIASSSKYYTGVPATARASIISIYG